jgi:hypothetical protein
VKGYCVASFSLGDPCDFQKTWLVRLPTDPDLDCQGQGSGLTHFAYDFPYPFRFTQKGAPRAAVDNLPDRTPHVYVNKVAVFFGDPRSFSQLMWVIAEKLNPQRTVVRRTLQ